MKLTAPFLVAALMGPPAAWAQAAPVAPSVQDPSAGQAADARAAEDITRNLNAGPPFAAPPPARPAAAAPAPGPEPASDPGAGPAAAAPSQGPSRAPVRESAPAEPSPDAGDITRSLNAGPPFSPAPRPDAGARPPAPVERETTPAVAPPASAPAVSPPSASRPETPAVAASPAAPPAAPPVRPAAATLGAAAIGALPFRVDLPLGSNLSEGPAGADAAVYAVRRDGRLLVMIYVGRQSQFPIYDGERIRRGGRETVVVTEEGRRLALEHLFQAEGEGRDIHVWVAAAEGADRDVGERIAHSVDPR